MSWGPTRAIQQLGSEWEVQNESGVCSIEGFSADAKVVACSNYGASDRAFFLPASHTRILSMHAACRPWFQAGCDLSHSSPAAHPLLSPSLGYVQSHKIEQKVSKSSFSITSPCNVHPCFRIKILRSIFYNGTLVAGHKWGGHWEYVQSANVVWGTLW